MTTRVDEAARLPDLGAALDKLPPEAKEYFKQLDYQFHWIIRDFAQRHWALETTVGIVPRKPGTVTGGATSPLTTKGDIWGYDAADNRIPVGANNRILTADSGQALGVSWKATIDGVAIGGTTPSSANFTTLTTTGQAAIGTWLGVGSYLELAEIAAPTPAALGNLRAWADSTSGTLKAEDGAGVASTTVRADSGASNNFLTAISANGVISKAQPAFSNLSGNISVSQMNSGTSASSSTFWRGDGTWAAASGGSSVGIAENTYYGAL